MINDKLKDEDLFLDALRERYPKLSMHQTAIYLFMLHGYSDKHIAKLFGEPFVAKMTEKIKYIKKKIL